MESSPRCTLRPYLASPIVSAGKGLPQIEESYLKLSAVFVAAINKS
jgi:hypothetical protein